MLPTFCDESLLNREVSMILVYALLSFSKVVFNLIQKNFCRMIFSHKVWVNLQ